MLIGIDIMGGDYAPLATVQGAILAQKELPDDNRLVLIGDENQAKQILSDEGIAHELFDFVHTTQVIGMDEHPSKAFSQKADSSITVGFNLLNNGKIDGFASAGSTGAMLVGVMYTIKSIPGVLRPVIATSVPQPSGKSTVLLDVGLNADCKPEILYQFGIIGSIFAKRVIGIDNPRVGLLNIGAEESKGNLLTKATYKLMQDTKDFIFVGNVEGTDLFSEKADVIVCDGFVGNVILKEAEAFYTIIKERKIEDKFFDKFDFENYGGTPILGINSNVIIGHGVSRAKAIKNMILHTKEVIDGKLPDKFKEVFQ